MKTIIKKKKGVGAKQAVKPTSALRQRPANKAARDESSRDCDGSHVPRSRKSTDAGSVARVSPSATVARRPKTKATGGVTAGVDDTPAAPCGPNPAVGGSEAGRDTDTNHASVFPHLLTLCRQRSREQQMRRGLEQTALATVKNAMGYGTWLPEDERKAIGERAEKMVKAAIGKGSAGDLEASDATLFEQIGPMVEMHYQVAKAHDKRIGNYEKPIIALVKQLPIAKWIEAPEQRGLGYLSVAQILGETGDLSLYASPAKVWKRMGCAPYRGKAPSTWRKSGGLKADEWVEIGYAPRRRAMMFIVANNLFMLNKDGEHNLPYRARFLEAKQSGAAAHPDWKPIHCQYHGNLLCAKRLLRELWRAWRSSL